MNAIEVLSNQYNFPMDEAVSLFTVKNKSKKTKKEGQSLQDMFAELVNDVEQDNREPVIVLEPTVAAAVAVAPVVKEKKEKAKKQPLSEEEKKQKAEELLAQKEAAKKQKADELLAQKEAAKKQKEDEKLAAKEAAKAAKAPKEPKAKAVKEPKAKAVKAVKETKVDDSPDRETPTWVVPPPIKITVTRVTIDGQIYLKSTAGILYNADTKEEVGLHDAETNTIKPLPEDGDEELEEDTYEA